MTQLTDRQRGLCERTMSTTAFYYLAMDAIERRGALSVVRMGDGERHLMMGDVGEGPVRAPAGHDPDWLVRLGVEGLSWRQVQMAIEDAATTCDYFAPSVTGIVDRRFSLHGLSEREQYVDNFFVNTWTDLQRIALMQAAGHVLMIHANPHTADALQLRAQGSIGVKVDFLRLTGWRDVDTVLPRAHESGAPLVLFSAGPASKWIASRMSRGGSDMRLKVALDLGNAMDQWTLSSLGPPDRPAAEAFAAEWRRTHT